MRNCPKISLTGMCYYWIQSWVQVCSMYPLQSTFNKPFSFIFFVIYWWRVCEDDKKHVPSPDYFLSIRSPFFSLSYISEGCVLMTLSLTYIWFYVPRHICLSFLISFGNFEWRYLCSGHLFREFSCASYLFTSEKGCSGNQHHIS